MAISFDMRAYVLVSLVLLAACGSQPASESSATEGMVFTLHCQDSWHDCYASARNRCDSGDFEELDRHGSATLGIDVRTAAPSTVGREQTTVNMVDRTITIRCK